MALHTTKPQDEIPFLATGMTSITANAPATPIVGTQSATEQLKTLAKELQEKEEILVKKVDNLTRVLALLGILKKHFKSGGRHLRSHRSAALIVSTCHINVTLFSIFLFHVGPVSLFSIHSWTYMIYDNAYHIFPILLHTHSPFAINIRHIFL